MKTPEDPERPNPDLLLKAVQREEAKKTRGKLKVFLGMAAGVGKTYAMLSAAQELEARGVDVLVGLVETHRRAETQALLAGLPLAPRKVLSHRGVEITEMDLDAILKRRPQIVLVDEMAHTNAPGSRHTKRYQDVFELLEAGMDVYTTLNVQHLESRADTVREITGVRVAETLPDSVIDLADEVVLVDLAPEELLQRLAEGKVYTAERAELAREHFFRPANLTALRELSLRMVAERVSRDLRDFQQALPATGAWKTQYRFMVGIYASPYSEKLIRWTRRMAASMDAHWYGAYVETDKPLTENERQLLAHNIALAKELGGEIIETVDQDAVDGLLRLARENKVNQLVIGKSRRNWSQNLRQGGSLTSRLLKGSGDIDVYVVAAEPAEQTRPPAPEAADAPDTLRVGKYLAAVLVPAAIGLLGYLLEPFLAYRAIGLVFLLGVSIYGLFAGRGHVLVAALASGVIWNFFFIPPLFTFTISAPEDFMMFGMFLAAAVIIGHLTSRLRGNEKHMQLRETRNNALYQMARELASGQSLDQALGRAVGHLGMVFKSEAAIFIRRSGGGLTAHPANTLAVDEQAKGVVEWVALNSRPAGLFTNTLSSAKAFFLPLTASAKTVGVLGLRPIAPKDAMPDFATLAETFAHQLAVAIEREQLNELAGRTRLAQESEKLYKSILNSISHEFKTPLAAIEGSASALLDPAVSGTAASVREIAAEIQEASQRLTRLVKNLLDMTRLESGVVPLRREPGDIRDLVGATLRRLDKELKGHPLALDIPGQLPLVPFDFILMEQALGNIIQNAAIYTEPGTPLSISARLEENNVVIEIRDQGPGLPTEDPEIIFNKFWRGDPHRTGGTGLGLAIARGWIAAHAGTIEAKNHPRGGAWFIIRLPLESPS